MKIRYLILSLCCLVGTDLAAQEATEVMPEPPFVAPMPERLKYTVTIKTSVEESNSAAATAAPTPAVSGWTAVKLESTKTGAYRHDVETFQNGQTRECWFVGEFMLEPGDDHKSVSIVNYKNVQGALALNSGNLPPTAGWDVFSWVQLAHYKGRINVGKEPCFHYALNANIKGSPEAWISIQTKMPVLYRLRNQTFYFQYSAPPVADLQLLPEYEKLWKQYQQVAEHAQKIKNSRDR